MKTKPPPDRRKFLTDWDEILHLREKLLYWLYNREDFGKARLYADRLAKRLQSTPESDEAIKGQECWSLIHEAAGNLQKAIAHRQEEIRLIRRLHDLAAKNPDDRPALADYGIDDLSDRLDLLAILQHDSGNLGEAIRTLEKSRALCRKHRIPFDGEDMLVEYLEEKDRQPARRKPA